MSPTTLTVVSFLWIIASCNRSSTLTVVTYGGGAYQQSHIDAFLEPFEQEEKVRTESVVWGAEYARLSEMVRSGVVRWDVVEVTAAQFSRGQRDNLFEAIEPRLDSSVFEPFPGSPTAHSLGVPNVYWSTVLAYRKRGTAPRPQSWADFWDTSRFPGSRALYDDPRGNLEFALIADGVELHKLYPLNIDRAFAKLEEIKPHVRVWWSDGTEPVRLLLNNQVELTSAWSGRIFASEQARAALDYSWSGAAHELDYWIIPRGTRNLELAARFIRFASSPVPMARQAEITAYGPANKNALDEVAKEILPHLPTAPENWSKSFVVNAAWWAQNEAAATARWILWRNQ